jgi:hypothetical protein
MIKMMKTSVGKRKVKLSLVRRNNKRSSEGPRELKNWVKKHVRKSVKNRRGRRNWQKNVRSNGKNYWNRRIRTARKPMSMI